MRKTEATIHVRPGLTLVEIMIAMALFTVGIAMVAAAFPTGIQQSQVTARTTMGMLIGENALAVCQAKLTEQAWRDRFGSNATNLQNIEDVNNPANDLLADDDQKCRDLTDSQGVVSLADSRYGWLALGRRVVDDGNDFLLVIVPYIKLPGGVTPQLVHIQITAVNPDPTIVELEEFTDSNHPAAPRDSYVAIGSPVIRADDGRFAFIVGLDDVAGSRFVKLSNDLELQENDEVFIVPAPPVVEDNPPLPPVARGMSPAVGCYAFRTALQP